MKYFLIFSLFFVSDLSGQRNYLETEWSSNNLALQKIKVIWPIFLDICSDAKSNLDKIKCLEKEVEKQFFKKFKWPSGVNLLEFGDTIRVSYIIEKNGTKLINVPEKT